MEIEWAYFPSIAPNDPGNGLYQVNYAGAWPRTTDADTSSSLKNAFFATEQGIYKGDLWVVTITTSSNAITSVSSTLFYNLDVPVTSSYADKAAFSDTSSLAFNSTNALFATSSLSSSYSLTSTNAVNAVNASFATSSLSSSYSLNSTNATNAGFATSSLSSSYALNSTTAVNANFATSSLSSSYALNSTNATNSINSNFATSSLSSSYSLTSTNATNASFATSSLSSSYSLTSTNATNSLNANFATSSLSSSYALNSTNATNSINADFATSSLSSSFANNAPTATTSSKGIVQVTEGNGLKLSNGNLLINSIYSASLNVTWDGFNTVKPFDTTVPSIPYSIITSNGTYISSVISASDGTNLVTAVDSTSGTLILPQSNAGWNITGYATGSNTDGSTTNIVLNSNILKTYSPIFYNLFSSDNTVISSYNRYGSQPGTTSSTIQYNGTIGLNPYVAISGSLTSANIGGVNIKFIFYWKFYLYC